VTASADRLVRRASVALSAGLVLMLVATAGTIAWPRLAATLGATPDVVLPYETGTLIDVPAAWYQGGPETLIVFARATCAACEKAQPFLKDLVGRMSTRGRVVMAHPPGAPDEDRKFGQDLGISRDRIHMTLEKLRVRATPTLVLVNGDGRVVRAWEGVGDEAQQATILAAIAPAK
jgi:peroxiredoxin